MSRIERWIDLRRRPVATAAVGVGLSPRAITAGAAATDGCDESERWLCFVIACRNFVVGGKLGK